MTEDIAIHTGANVITIPLTDRQGALADIIHRNVPGEVVTITENGQPVAQLITVGADNPRPPRPRPLVTGVPRVGQYEGRLVVPEDFDDPISTSTV